MTAELRNANAALAEQGAARDFFALSFAGMGGLLAVLRVLSARTDPHALGVRRGATDRAVANGVPGPDSMWFGAGLFLS